MQHQRIMKRVNGAHEWSHRPYQHLSAPHYCWLYNHRWQDERQLTGAHLYLDITKSDYLFHGYSHCMRSSYMYTSGVTSLFVLRGHCDRLQFDLMCSSDAMGWHISPSHYLNECWLMGSEVMCHSPEDNLFGNAQDMNHLNMLQNCTFKVIAISLRREWVNIMLLIKLVWQRLALNSQQTTP